MDISPYLDDSNINFIMKNRLSELNLGTSCLILRFNYVKINLFCYARKIKTSVKSEVFFCW